MSKKILSVLALSVAVSSLSACTWYDRNFPTTKAPGTYKETAEHTNSSGTKTTTKQTTNVYRDASGDKKAVVKTETTSDPKGLFNKETNTTYKRYN